MALHGQVIDEEGQRVMNCLATDEMVVIQHQREVVADGGDGVDEAGEDELRSGLQEWSSVKNGSTFSSSLLRAATM